MFLFGLLELSFALNLEKKLKERCKHMMRSAQKIKTNGKIGLFYLAIMHAMEPVCRLRMKIFSPTLKTCSLFDSNMSQTG